MVPEQEKTLRNLVLRYPDSQLLKEKLVQYFRDSGDYKNAIEETAKALAQDSLNTRLLEIKATLLFEDGDTSSAIKELEKAVSLDPRSEYIITLGSLYAQTKNPMALTMSDALLHSRVPANQTKAIFIKGLYYSFTGEKEKALSFFNSCLQTDYRDLPAYREKAICLYDLDKYTEALGVLQQAITVQKSFDEGYYWMGRCYEKLNKRKEATESYELALQIDPGYVEAQEALARIK